MSTKKWLLIGLGAFAIIAGIRTEAFAGEALELGMEVYYFNYEEPDFMEDTGAFVGVNGRYTRHFSGLALFSAEPDVPQDDESSLLRLEGRFAYGMVDYTSETTGEMDNIDDFVFETRLMGGYDFAFSDETTLTPYFGVGYRYLNDDSGGEVTSTGHNGYERESNYFYLPVGFDLHGPINDEWSFNVNGEFDIFIFGEQKSHLGDAVAGLGSVTNDQEGGWGARGSVRLTRAGETTDFFIEPFVRYWHIDDSEISAITFGGVSTGYGLEPENTTIEAGAKVGLRF